MDARVDYEFLSPNFSRLLLYFSDWRWKLSAASLFDINGNLIPSVSNEIYTTLLGRFLIIEPKYRVLFSALAAALLFLFAVSAESFREILSGTHVKLRAVVAYLFPGGCNRSIIFFLLWFQLKASEKD